MNGNVSLDPEAHLLIEQAFPEPPPSEEACRRMSLKLAPMLAAGAGSSLLKPSVELSAAMDRGSASPWRWEKLTTSAWGKLAFGMLTSALMVGAFYLGRATSRRAEPVSVVIPQVVSTAQLSVKTELARVDHARPAEPAPSSAPIMAPPASVSKPKSPNRSRSADGLAILGEVELALRRGNPGAALARLDGLGEPTSTRLQHLSRVLRAIALCDAGRVDEGRMLMVQLQENGRSSVFSARLDRACEGSPSREH